ncbi:MAG: CocE/NonD family hydrolase [Candidatus Hodarchaeota archaeon]
MFDWFTLIFRLFGLLTEFLFDVNVALTVNLPIIGACVGVYLLAFYLNYIKLAERGSSDEKPYLPCIKDKIDMGVKLGVILLLGFLSGNVALFLGTFLLMVSGGYFKSIGKRKSNEKRWGFIGNLLYWLAPILIGAIGVMAGGIFAVIGPVIGMLLYQYWGRIFADLSMKEMFERYGWKFFLRIPITVRYILIALIIGIPVLVISWLYIGNFAALELWLNAFYYLMVPELLFGVNLPIIVIARGIRIYSFNTYYKNYPGREKAGGNGKLFDKYQKRYYNLKNVAIILSGILVIYLALLFATYSLLMSISYIKKPSEEGRKDNSSIMKLLIYVLVPVMATIAIIVYSITYSSVVRDPGMRTTLAIVPMAAATAGGVLAWMFKGKHYGMLSFKELVDDYKKKVTKKVPKLLQVIFTIFIIGLPVFGAIGIGTLGTVQKETYMIRMADGVHLATDVYYAPSVGKNPAPVILVRTPYGKDMTGAGYALIYTPQGYHVVVQDMRGTYDSEGGTKDFLLFTKSAEDGVETIEWIIGNRNESWTSDRYFKNSVGKKLCNGNIGSAGASALCINQFYYAGMPNVSSALKAQQLWFGAPDIYLDAIMGSTGTGAYHQSSVETWINGTAQENWRYQVDFILDHIENANWSIKEYNMTNLNQGINNYSSINVRGIHVGGWYDHFLGGTIRGYIGYSNHSNTTSRAYKHQKLVIGPWQHVGIYGGRTGELTYPGSSNAIPLLLRWETEIFDESLKGKATTVWNEPNVAYYLMGDPSDNQANYWKYSEDWPLKNKSVPWYFSSNNTDGFYTLFENDTHNDPAKNMSYLYDPRDPVFVAGGNNQPGFDTAGPQDQRKVENQEDGSLRSDILLFQTPILKKPYVFEGNLTASLMVYSNCTDTDFMVMLEDIYPDGRRINIIDSALTMRFRDDMYNKLGTLPMDNTTQYNITVDLMAMAYRFAPGHRIAVTITSSNYDRYAINMNDFNIPIGKGHFSDSVIANNTIVTGFGKSCIWLPVLDE